MTGSSPLARGLLVLPYDTRADERIIPARAGFTPDAPAGAGSISDHPRSRGVYFAHLRAQPADEGSSQLARGLLDRASLRASISRIIPARAGFTDADIRRAYRGGGSSPLARGLLDQAVDDLDGTGSSPLARGLRARYLAQDSNGGIIPARAGFTAEGPRSYSK